MFFFWLWPLFARAPRHWFLENFLLSAPGVQSVFFVALRWAPRPFGGAREKKNTTQGVFFFFAPAPGKGKGRRSPVGRRHGARAKKNTPPRVFFFCCGPGEKQGKEKPRWAPARGQSKKRNTTEGVFFFFFCSGPVPAPNGASPSLAFRRGRSKKNNTLGGVFFFAAAPRGRSLTHCGPGWRCLPLAGVVFFFLLRPRRPGWCFFFFCGPAGSF